MKKLLIKLAYWILDYYKTTLIKRKLKTYKFEFKKDGYLISLFFKAHNKRLAEEYFENHSSDYGIKNAYELWKEKQ